MTWVCMHYEFVGLWIFIIERVTSLDLALLSSLLDRRIKTKIWRQYTRMGLSVRLRFDELTRLIGIHDSKLWFGCRYEFNMLNMLHNPLKGKWAIFPIVRIEHTSVLLNHLPHKAAVNFVLSWEFMSDDFVELHFESLWLFQQPSKISGEWRVAGLGQQDWVRYTEVKRFWLVDDCGIELRIYLLWTPWKVGGLFNRVIQQGVNLVSGSFRWLIICSHPNGFRLLLNYLKSFMLSRLFDQYFVFCLLKFFLHIPLIESRDFWQFQCFWLLFSLNDWVGPVLRMDELDAEDILKLVIANSHYVRWCWMIGVGLLL